MVHVLKKLDHILRMWTVWKRNYTKEYRVQTCELVLKDNLKVKSVDNRMGLSYTMHYRWIDEYKIERILKKNGLVTKNKRNKKRLKQTEKYIYKKI